jgi:hypothetical protein
MAKALRLALAVTALAAAGCHKRPRTPDEAFLRVEHDLAASDGVDLFQCLDQQTRWAIEGAYKDQRLMRTIIQAKYPESEAERALAPLAAAAEDDVPRYFAHVARDRHTLEGLRPRLGSGAIATKLDGEGAAILSRPDGAPLHFKRGKDGSWGLAELYTDWQLEQDRASHAVRTVRDNATLYQKAEQR